MMLEPKSSHPLGGPFGAAAECFLDAKDRLFDYAVRMLRNTETAEDIVQESLVRLYRQEQDGRLPDRVEAWLFVCVRNLCLNHLRDMARFRDDVDVSNVSALVGAPPSENERRLRVALDRLEPIHKEILILREYQGMNYSEIAEVLDLTLPAVRSLLFRARLSLRETYFKTIAR